MLLRDLALATADKSASAAAAPGRSQVIQKEICSSEYTFPMTAIQTANGVDKSSPMAPHTQVQKIAATRMATGDTLVLLP